MVEMRVETLAVRTAESWVAIVVALTAALSDLLMVA